MAGDDPTYLDWIRSRPCAAPLGCTVICHVEPHHPRHNVGGAMRAHDHRAVPLCRTHHIGHLHGLTGQFKGWTRERLRAWLDEFGAQLRAEYLRRFPNETQGETQ